MYIKNRGRRFLTFLVILFFSCKTTSKVTTEFKKATGNKPSVIDLDSSMFVSVDPNLPPPILEFYYTDDEILGNQHSITLDNISPNPLLIKRPSFLIQMDNSSILYYVYPDSRLTAIQNNKGYVELIDKSKTSDSNKNIELNFFQLLSNKLGRLWQNKYFPYDGDSSSIADKKFYKNRTQIKELKNIRFQFLDSIATVHTLSHTFLETAKNLINYAALEDIIRLDIIWRNYLISRKLFISEIDSLLSQIEEYSKKPTYYFENVCRSLRNLIQGNEISIRLLHTPNEYENNTTTIQTYFKGFAKELLLGEQYLLALGKHLIDEDLFFEKVNLLSNTRIKNRLFEKYKDFPFANLSKKISYELQSIQGKKTSFEDIIKLHTGKMLYIDFWASWCVPCRENMLELKKIEPELEKIGVDIINISLDNSISKWKVATFASKLKINNSYIFLNKDSSAFVRKHNLSEIPRYFVIGKNGQFIDTNAPPPSDSSLVNRLIEHSKKQ